MMVNSTTSMPLSLSLSSTPSSASPSSSSSVSASTGAKILEVLDPCLVEVLQSRHVRLHELFAKYRNFTNKYVFNCNCATNIDLNSEYNELELQYKRFVAETTVIPLTATTTPMAAIQSYPKSLVSTPITSAGHSARTLVLTGGSTSKLNGGGPSPQGPGNFAVLINPTSDHLYRDSTTTTSNNNNNNTSSTATRTSSSLSSSSSSSLSSSSLSSNATNHNNHSNHHVQPHLQQQQQQHPSIITTTINNNNHHHHQLHTSIIEPHQVRGVTNILSRRLTSGGVGATTVTSSNAANFLSSTTTSQQGSVAAAAAQSNNSGPSPMPFLTSPVSASSSSTTSSSVTSNHVSLSHHHHAHNHSLDGIDPALIKLLDTSNSTTATGVTLGSNHVKLMQSSSSNSNATVSHNHHHQHSNLLDSLTQVDSLDYSPMQTSFSPTPCSMSSANLRNSASISGGKQNVTVIQSLTQPTTLILANHTTTRQDVGSQDLQSNLTNHHLAPQQHQTNHHHSLQSNLLAAGVSGGSSTFNKRKNKLLSTLTSVSKASASAPLVVPAGASLTAVSLEALCTPTTVITTPTTVATVVGGKMSEDEEASLVATPSVLYLDNENLALLETISQGFYRCETAGCSYTTSIRANMASHLRSQHGVVRPYRCNFAGCEASFKEKYKLKVHAVVHTKEKPFACDHPGCKSRFSQSGHLSRHKKMHGDQAPRFACTVLGCSRTFIQKHSLKYHLMMHRGEKPWECEMPGCGRKFIEKWKLVKHQKIHVKEQQQQQHQQQQTPNHHHHHHQQQQQQQQTAAHIKLKQSLSESIGSDSVVPMVSVLEKPTRTVTIVRHSTLPDRK